MPMIKFVCMLLLALALQSCGYQQMKREQFSVDTAWSNLIVAYKTRDQAVEWATRLVAASGDEGSKLVLSLEDSRAKVEALNASGMVTHDPSAFAAMRMALTVWSSAAAAVVDAGSRIVGAGGQSITEQTRSKWISTLKDVADANAKIAAARKMYGIAAGTYNDVLSVFPNAYTAKIVGFGMIPSFDSPLDAKGQPTAQRLTESLRGHVE